MEEITLITIMARLIILATVLSVVMRKLKMPTLVGFLAAGIVIANCLTITEDLEEIVKLFANLGLIMLMFSIGMEIDMSKLKTQGRFALIVALVQMPLMVVGGIVTGIIMGLGMVQCIALGAIISGSSTAVVMAVLKEREILDREHVEVLVLVMIMEDIGQVIMLSVLTPMLSGLEVGTNELLVLIIKIAIFMVACFTIGLKLVPKIINWFQKRTTDELLSLLCIGGLFALSLAASNMGLSVAIGAFLMGIMVAASKAHHTVEGYVDPLKSLFMAMFFISVGMEVSLNSLIDNIVLVIVIFAVFALFKTCTVYLGYWVGNGDSRKGFISAVSLCAMGEFAFIIAKQALDAEAIDNGLYSAVIGAALVSMIILPVMSNSSGRAYDVITARLPMKRMHMLSERRDRFYASLGTLPGRTRNAMSKAAATAYANVMMIIIISVLFYLYTTKAGESISEYFGIDYVLVMFLLLVAHILILLPPCYYLMKNLRVVMYIVDLSKHDPRDTDQEHIKFYQVMNPLVLAGALDIAIVVIIPDAYYRLSEVIYGALIIGIIVIYQYWRFHRGKFSRPVEVKEEEPVPGPRPMPEQGARDEAGP